MKISAVPPALILSIVFAATPAQAGSPSFEECAQRAKTVRIGALRQDIPAGFEPDGGISSHAGERLIIKGCRQPDNREVKIEIKFDLSRDGLGPNEPTPSRPADKIKWVSEPYLDFMTMD